MQAMAAEPGDPVDRARKAVNSVSPNLAEEFVDAQLHSLAAAGFRRPNQFRKVTRQELLALGLTPAQADALQQGELQRPGPCGCTHDCFAIELLDRRSSGKKSSAHADSIIYPESVLCMGSMQAGL